MDPWGERQESVTHLELKITLKFEDNFSPSLRDTLPDSDQYLAALEERLRRLKSNPNVLKQLAEKREACMQQLLKTDSTYESESFYESVDIPVTNSQLVRTICPQRQALNQSELVELVKHDQLNSERENADLLKENTDNYTP